MGENVTEITRVQANERRGLWEQIATSRAETANLPERQWYIGCRDEASCQIRRERFEQLAEHAAGVELRISFGHRCEAVDSWLDLLQKESRFARGFRIKPLCIAAGEYCAELKIRALKAGDRSKAETLSEIGLQFRELAGPSAMADTGARRIFWLSASPRPHSPHSKRIASNRTGSERSSARITGTILILSLRSPMVRR